MQPLRNWHLGSVRNVYVYVQKVYQLVIIIKLCQFHQVGDDCMFNVCLALSSEELKSVPFNKIIDLRCLHLVGLNVEGGRGRSLKGVRVVRGHAPGPLGACGGSRTPFLTQRRLAEDRYVDLIFCSLRPESQCVSRGAVACA